ncbi:MAG: 16S rRNA (guanine(527)-N(7))-methyltransferase RsmG [Candidatus Dependentiae bacterium]|nr:16S rRNA (guanine(527)-N(7))-methyltransferase RsmG [Candidatus Dependentiae bacterium]
MNLIDQLGKKGEQAWKQFCKKYELTGTQQEQFARYISLLRTWNENINLTAITEPATIITHHFQDSLEISNYIDIEKMAHIVDVGSGAGFPGIPLKIKYPEIKITLIEVTGKKIAFLRMVIQELGLEGIELYTLDWRTFLRKTDEPVDLFVSRASLAPAELVRMFKPSSPYKDSLLIYWASKEWQSEAEELPFLQKEYSYQIGSKKRRFIVFSAHALSKTV